MNAESAPNTFFAPAGRACADELSETATLALSDPVVQVFLESVGGLVLVLNRQRQILAGNQELLEALGLEILDTMVGLRPGEAFNCVNCHIGPDGCGTSENCSVCGAVISILACQDNNAPSVGECFMNMRREGLLQAIEFEIRCTPLRVGCHDLVIMVLHDISDEKRRQMLERVFLHDLNNTLMGLIGWSAVLSSESERDAAKSILGLSVELSQSIEQHMMLQKAEQGRLEINRAEVSSAEILDDIRLTFHNHPAALNRALIIEASAVVTLHTDQAVLMRVLINMVTNALEAIGEAEIAKISFSVEDGQPVFRALNPGVIPHDMALSMFHRSVTTKGAGRGLGTYSMKLLGEDYLNGNVDFTSTEEEGTIFELLLPRESVVAD